jgi:hypothetical protein
LILISSLWDKDVESDTASHRFSYTIGVIGMHPKASRLARTFPYPTVVFNLHEQFERLRARKVRGDETDDTGARDDVPRFDQPHAVELRRKLRGASIFRPSCVRGMPLPFSVDEAVKAVVRGCHRLLESHMQRDSDGQSA